MQINYVHRGNTVQNPAYRMSVQIKTAITSRFFYLHDCSLGRVKS